MSCGSPRLEKILQDTGIKLTSAFSTDGRVLGPCSSRCTLLEGTRAAARTRGAYYSAPAPDCRWPGTNRAESRPQPCKKVTLAPNGTGLLAP